MKTISEKIIGLFALALMLLTSAGSVSANEESEPLPCESLFENFDPNPYTAVDYGEPVEFRWNGPGCSEKKWDHYLLCFENINNPSESACFGSPANNLTLSIEEWKSIDGQMKTVNSPKQVNTRWFILSIFGEGTEILKTQPWEFSYIR